LVYNEVGLTLRPLYRTTLKKVRGKFTVKFGATEIHTVGNESIAVKESPEEISNKIHRVEK